MTQVINNTNIFECSICLFALLKPITLSCGHNFCQPCIKNKGFKILKPLCPICRQEILIKPKHYNVNLLLEKLVLQEYSKDQTYMERYNTYQRYLDESKHKNIFVVIYKKIKKYLLRFLRAIKQKYHYFLIAFIVLFLLLKRIKINVFNLEVPAEYKNKALEMVNKMKEETTIDFNFLLLSQFVRILFSSILIR